MRGIDDFPKLTSESELNQQSSRLVSYAHHIIRRRHQHEAKDLLRKLFLFNQIRQQYWSETTENGFKIVRDTNRSDFRKTFSCVDSQPTHSPENSCTYFIIFVIHTFVIFANYASASKKISRFWQILFGEICSLG